MAAVVATSQTILVVGGGVSGMTAALEAAECGKQVVLVEKSPTLGGRTAILYRYFPKLCHPVCGLEINLRRLTGKFLDMKPGSRIVSNAFPIDGWEADEVGMAAASVVLESW